MRGGESWKEWLSRWKNGYLKCNLVDHHSTVKGGKGNTEAGKDWGRAGVGCVQSTGNVGVGWE